MCASDKQKMLTIDRLQVSYLQEGIEQPVLNYISFELYKGEILSLLGESGSGKSTIAKAIIGLLSHSARISDGTLCLAEEQPMKLLASTRAWSKIRGRGIAMLFQDARLALNPVMKIKDHFRETLTVHKLAKSDEIISVSEHWLDRLGFADTAAVLDSYPHELSGGMCQRICLALTLCLRPKVLIADEPTSALDTVNKREVLDLLQSLQRELDLTVLLITHDIVLAHDLSHRVVVLHEGSIVEMGEASKVLTKPEHVYTKHLLASRELTPQPKAINQLNLSSLMEVKQLVKFYGPSQRVLNGVNLRVHEGEIIGVLGQSGCGKSTLARCVLGLETVDRGSITFRNQEISGLKGKARRKLAKHIQLVFQDARASLNPSDTALELVQAPLNTFRMGNRRERLEHAQYLLEEVGIRAEAQRRRPPQLSTGQCQRVAIARALALKPDVLICDEAVSALDMSVQAQILELLQRLQRQLGFSIVMISHDVRVLRAFCHQIAVMHDGNFIEIVPGNELHTSKHPHTSLLLHCSDELEEELNINSIEESNLA